MFILISSVSAVFKQSICCYWGSKRHSSYTGTFLTNLWSSELHRLKEFLMKPVESLAE